MRTSLRDIKRQDDFLLGQLPAADRLVMDAEILINDTQKTELNWLKYTHRIIGLFARREVRRELHQIHEQIFNEPSHREIKEKVLSFFNRPQ